MDDEVAQHWANSALTRRPEASIAHFFKAFPLQDKAVSKALHDALKSLGFPDR